MAAALSPGGIGGVCRGGGGGGGGGMGGGGGGWGGFGICFFVMFSWCGRSLISGGRNGQWGLQDPNSVANSYDHL